MPHVQLGLAGDYDFIRAAVPIAKLLIYKIHHLTHTYLCSYPCVLSPEVIHQFTIVAGTLGNDAQHAN